jgi:hypothetical protein
MKLNALLLMVLATATSCLTPDGPFLEVQNPYNQPVLGKSFVVDRPTVESVLQGEWSDSKSIKVTDQKGRVLSSQLDDLDGDGLWDELVFQASFNVDELLQLSIEVVDASELGEVIPLTNIRFARKAAPNEEVTDDLRLKSIVPQSQPFIRWKVPPGRMMWLAFATITMPAMVLISLVNATVRWFWIRLASMVKITMSWTIGVWMS